MDAATTTPDIDLKVDKNTPIGEQMAALGISQRDMGRALRISKSAVSRLAQGRWPTKGRDLVKSQVYVYLARKRAEAATGIKWAGGQDVMPETEANPIPDHESQPQPEEEQTMLLQNTPLSLEARKHFNLPRSPFIDDVASPDDVFQNASVRYVRAALMDCAMHHGFVAVVGESGAGKTTLSEDLEERIKAAQKDVVMIRPYILAMEHNDEKGKTLKASHIAEAIAVALDPAVKVAASHEARFGQVHRMLRESRMQGRRHLLVIEEAHCMPTATLKHLKRFLELKDGMQRLIGVALIGQPELRVRLSAQNPEVREVMQRCELIELEPLDSDVEGYLKHKFARFDMRYEDVFEADAADAIRARLVQIPRGARAESARSLCYPLVVNNLVCKAMNAAARAGWGKVNADCVAGC